jgi:peptidoglycan/xylan/chitin deacetylase (PgdA/CDA1 family)
VADKIIAAFRAHHLPPVVGFANGKKADDDPRTTAVLDHWLAAGNRLGNHTWSHPSLNATALDAYLADIDRGESFVERVSPGAAKTFRYPFLFEGDSLEKKDGVRAHLRAEGYAVAEVTIDADDWAYNPPFARCAERGDLATLARLRADFVAGHVEELRRMRALTRELAGHEVAQVLLLHIGVADADAMDDLLGAYEKEGARFVTLEAALADTFYGGEPPAPYKYGAAFPYVVAKSRGVPLPTPPIFARDLEERLARICR